MRTALSAVALLLALAVPAAACDDEPTDDTPAGALTLFLDAMERSSRDDHALEEAYHLLAADARHALEVRAERASSLSHRDFSPWDMLAQGRYRRRFALGSPMRESIEGDHATVTVLGSREGERADVSLVHERSGWRVVLEIPEMTGVDREATR